MTGPSGGNAPPTQPELSEEAGAGRAAHLVVIERDGALQCDFDRLDESYGPRRVVTRGRHVAQPDRFRAIARHTRALIAELQRDDLFAEWGLDSDLPIPND